MAFGIISEHSLYIVVGGVFWGMQINRYIKNASDCIGHFEAPSSIKKLSEYLSLNVTEKPLVLCVGTDRCIGDVLAPLTGTILQRSNVNFPVYGTLEYPVHALNIYSNLRKIKTKHPQAFVIAVDASLGHENEIGNIIVRKGFLCPGKGVGKNLPTVGDIAIVGIVEAFKSNVALVIHNIRLHFVMSIAEVIADVIMEGLCEKETRRLKSPLHYYL